MLYEFSENTDYNVFIVSIINALSLVFLLQITTRGPNGHHGANVQ